MIIIVIINKVLFTHLVQAAAASVCFLISQVPEYIMSSPANDEARQEALRDGL